MNKKIVSGITLTLLLLSILTVAFNIQQVKASGTVYIRADGSIDPPTAPISTVDNITYTLTGNIISDSDGIVVERDNIVVDGAGYRVQGTGALDSKGIDLSSRNNVTVKNVEVTNFDRGIYLDSSSNNTLIGNNASSNYNYGITLHNSSNNILIGNNASDSSYGIVLWSSSSNTLSGNTASNNMYGIYLNYSSNNVLSGNNASNNGDAGIILNFFNNNNTLSGNTASNNHWGIYLGYSSNNNTLFHNNLIDNTVQASVTAECVNTWDDGYPSGGNYWSDYAGNDTYSGPYQNETGSDEIGDTPYIINANNQDNYPLMEPWSSTTILNTNITKGGEPYDVQVASNVTILDFQETPGSIKLTVSGESGTSGYVRIIQPIGLNSTNIKVFLNKTKLTFPSIDPPRSISSNGTHYFIYFAFTFNSAYEVTVAFPIEGDVNYDGVVDIFDIGTISSHWYPGPPEGPLGFDGNADINDDDAVDISDIDITSAHWGQSW